MRGRQKKGQEREGEGCQESFTAETNRRPLAPVARRRGKPHVTENKVFSFSGDRWRSKRLWETKISFIKYF